MPVFWLAAILLNYLAYESGIFPSQGICGTDRKPSRMGQAISSYPGSRWRSSHAGFYSRVLRSNMLDTMNEDYVRTARAKGFSERRVMSRHVMRNSLIPVVTLFGLDFGALSGGEAILIEAISSLHGIGEYGYQREIINTDLPPIMAITLFGAFFVVLFNALVDIAYAWLDPRIRLGYLGAMRRRS